MGTKTDQLYALTKPNGVRPPTVGTGEGEVIYMCMESESARPKSFDELVNEAKARKLQVHLKSATSTTVEESLRYWLNKFAKNGWIQILTKA
jgi:hypothetical protein